MNTRNKEGWRRLWVAANMIWVIGGIIVGIVFITVKVYPEFIRYGYDTEVTLILLAVLAWIVLPPVGLRIAFHIGQWIYEGFRGGRPVMSAELSSQSSAAQIEGAGKAEDCEAAGLDQTQDDDVIKRSFSDIMGNKSFQYCLIELYKQKRKYVHRLPLLFVLLEVATLFSFTTLSYRYEPGDSELLRNLFFLGMLVPPLALIVYVCLVYIYLGYSVFKGRLSKFTLIMALLLPAIGVFVAAAATLSEMAGRFEFGLFVLASEQDVLFNILSEGAGRVGLPFVVIHLALFSLFEKKRNPESMANVLLGWSLAGLVITFSTILLT
ncbi:hypothetical protein ELY33_04970 [Vreelandella andesensis]|uniref:Uncharacterized protein n=1 Tax=Vreelandella andesensis TaxID=447567 RepID=A0A3S0W9S0_9GAMM|nr:hypothetical protein [Halomonas andesensis]RUR32734.1 hypothetical protein ELY33_04970 [Halomonas andesensis]